MGRLVKNIVFVEILSTSRNKPLVCNSHGIYKDQHYSTSFQPSGFNSSGKNIRSTRVEQCLLHTGISLTFLAGGGGEGNWFLERAKLF